MTKILDEVIARAAAAEEAKRALARSVNDARWIHSWQEIGEALGVTRQAAQQRFSPKRRELDPVGEQLGLEF